MASSTPAKTDIAKMWSLHHRMVASVIGSVAPAIAGLGLEVKELLLLAEIDDHPHPAELAAACLMPKPTVTLYVKRLEAAGLLTREIDTVDLRRHNLSLTHAGRKLTTTGMSMIAKAFGRRLARLGAAEQRDLYALLAKLV